LIDDLRRKDFVAFKPLEDDEVLQPGLIDGIDEAFRAARPFMRFLCTALTLPC
jgi:uncharacterized protein (DUF2461 family)